MCVWVCAHVIRADMCVYVCIHVTCSLCGHVHTWWFFFSSPRQNTCVHIGAMGSASSKKKSEQRKEGRGIEGGISDSSSRSGRTRR